MQEVVRDATNDAKIKAASELIRLFAQARHAITTARWMALRAGGDPEITLARMRCRLIETVWEDFLLFDEPTIYALTRFVDAWRTAAYAPEDRQSAADDALEDTYGRVLRAFGTCLGIPSKLGELNLLPTKVEAILK